MPMTKYIFQISMKSNAITVCQNLPSHLPCEMKEAEECAGSLCKTLSCQHFNGFPAPVGSKSNYRHQRKYSKWKTDCLAFPKLLENKQKLNPGLFQELKGNLPSLFLKLYASSWKWVFQSWEKEIQWSDFFYSFFPRGQCPGGQWPAKWHCLGQFLCLFFSVVFS